MASRRTLHVGQPVERAEPDLAGPAVIGPPPAEDQGVRQLGIVIRDNVFEPLPIVRGGVFVAFDQSAGERVADLVDQAVAAQAAAILVGAQKRQGPGPRRNELGAGQQRLLEGLDRPGRQSEIVGPPDARAHSPHCPAEAVVRADLFLPAAVEGHEVAKPPPIAIESGIEKRGISHGRLADLRRTLPALLQ